MSGHQFRGLQDIGAHEVEKDQTHFGGLVDVFTFCLWMKAESRADSTKHSRDSLLRLSLLTPADKYSMEAFQSDSLDLFHKTGLFLPLENRPLRYSHS
jgi:hypothetical protein